MLAFMRHHITMIVSVIIFSVLFACGLIWMDLRMQQRAKQYPAAAPNEWRHRPTFVVNESLPVDLQIAEHPGKTPRTYRTNIQWLKQHQQDMAHISALELEVMSLKADKALASGEK